MYGGVRIDPRFLHLSVLDGGEWSATRTGRFFPDEGAAAAYRIGG